MPKYYVEVTRRLDLSTTLTVTAKNEDEAEGKAEALLTESTIEWTIKDTYDWDETADDLTIDHVEEA
jgi:hypothetical protein